MPKVPEHLRRVAEGGTTERRYVSVSQFELRDDDAGGLSVLGHATVFDTPYQMYGGAERGGWDEQIAAGAFTKTLREKADVNFLINHEGMSLARTKSGTLRLEEDNVGLRVEASLDPDNSDVKNLRSAMDRGDIDEMSFAFRVVRQEWDDDFTQRRITEVNMNRGDVSAVNYGANPNTSVALRAAELLEQLGAVDEAAALAELRADGDTSPVELVGRARAVLDRLAADLTPTRRGLRLTVAQARALANDSPAA